ncbi:MAG: HEAT repeat domain-containing protein [Microcystaceae cyanobacterium]
MQIQQIEVLIDSENPQERMKAIAELRDYEPSVVIPLLQRRINDSEFIVRSLVAIGLGNQLTDEGFESLLTLIESDPDYNVRAEAANSLANYGERAIPHLVLMFQEDSHRLIQLSILAAVAELDQPSILLDLIDEALLGSDPIVELTAISYLTQLKGTNLEEKALLTLEKLSMAEEVDVRVQVAKVLGTFEGKEAKTLLAYLRQDKDHRVVGATWEHLLN